MTRRKLSRAEIEQRRAAGSVSSDAKVKAARAGGRSTSRAKGRAVRENGKRGGRPGNPAIKRIMRERGVTRQAAWKIFRRKSQ